MSALPAELERGLLMAHRSPTYAVALSDGRTLRIRREAQAFKADHTDDRAVLAAGGGKVVWWARCGDSETWGETLGSTLIRALGIPVGEAEQQLQALDFDAWWEHIKLLTEATLKVANAAVPCEQQGVSS